MKVKSFIKLLLTFPMDYDVKIGDEDSDLFSIEKSMGFHKTKAKHDLIISSAPQRIKDLPKKTPSYNRLWVNKDECFIVEGKMVKYAKLTYDGIEYDIKNLED